MAHPEILPKSSREAQGSPPWSREGVLTLTTQLPPVVRHPPPDRGPDTPPVSSRHPSRLTKTVVFCNETGSEASPFTAAFTAPLVTLHGSSRHAGALHGSRKSCSEYSLKSTAGAEGAPAANPGEPKPREKKPGSIFFRIEAEFHFSKKTSVTPPFHHSDGKIF